MTTAPPHSTGTPEVRRQAYLAQLQIRDRGDQHPAVYKPWETLVKEAEARMRLELTDALRRLEHDTAQAGQILDVAVSLADSTARQLADAAWAEWRRLMEAAHTAAEAVLVPAREAYDSETERAAQAFDRALTAAKRAYERSIHDADQSRTLADQMKKAP